MAYPTKVQVIQRQTSQQWYVTLPAALARSLQLHKSESFEWSLQDGHTLLLRRVRSTGEPQPGKKRRAC